MSKVELRWVVSNFMVGVDSRGNSITIGSRPEQEPGWGGMKPSDLLLLAAASCSAYDVVGILKKQREPLQTLEVVCNGEQGEEPPYAFSEIHLHYRVFGKVDEKKLERAIMLSEDKYCSVINSLKSGVKISSDYEIFHMEPGDAKAK